eukprot:5337714-Prymnesium_polylepis.1
MRAEFTLSTRHDPKRHPCGSVGGRGTPSSERALAVDRECGARLIPVSELPRCPAHTCTTRKLVTQKMAYGLWCAVRRYRALRERSLWKPNPKLRQCGLKRAADRFRSCSRASRVSRMEDRELTDSGARPEAARKVDRFQSASAVSGIMALRERKEC